MFVQLTKEQKRLRFKQTIAWGQLHRLMVDDGLLVANADGSCTVAVERAAAMLCLTAIHDIMKLEALLPVVCKEHAPYRGRAAGERIVDHDEALGYVLDHDGAALPCFSALSAAQQKPIRFTQSKMGFNHGWLVQAEAPPGALFSKFKECIETDDVHAEDIAFYFVHWLTDLAGAEATPLHGAEKFVVKFPHSVLASFIRSFSIVQRLAHTTESELPASSSRSGGRRRSGRRRAAPTPSR